MTLVEEFLSHHGVKGMKWGIRKDRRSGNAKGSTSSHKPAHELSDEELKRAIERMNLEQQYKNLLNPKPPKKDSEAAKFVKEMGKNLTKDIIKSTSTKLLDQVLLPKK